MSDDAIKFDINILLGHCEIEQRQIPGPGRDILFQGRSKHYDRHGVLVETTPWETVSRLYWPEPAPRPWWKRLFSGD